MVKSETAPPGASSSSLTEHKMRKKKYKGVRMRSWGSWVSEIRSPNQKTRIWLGSYATAEAAARAYDAALLCIKGSSASSILNFPISDASHYGIPHDGNPLMSPKSIQRAAAAAAASSGGVSGASAPSPSAPPPALSTSMDYSPSSMSYSSPLINQQHDDDVSPAEHNNRFHEMQASETMATVDSWCNFESPKYSDLMVNGAAFDAVSTASYMADDAVIEEGDIRLWSFC